VARRPEFTSFGGADGPLGALRWEGITGAPTVVALHGITGNAWDFDPLVHRLGGAAHLVALDLRGRGRSYDHPGPFGVREHAADLIAVIGQIGGPVVVVAHSMGCYVALLAARRAPELIAELILVDGGPALPVPDGVDLDDVVENTLGPAIKRLKHVWPDRVSYNTMWAQHPAFRGRLSIDLERNLLADLIEVDGGFRAAVNPAAVRIDGRELLADREVRSLLAERHEPAVIVRAAHGLDGAPPPLISRSLAERYPQHRWVEAPDDNHYTVLLGSTGAELVAGLVREALTATR
jgi:pimeloyl-ACP methyl ester carboxylesterase